MGMKLSIIRGDILAEEIEIKKEKSKDRWGVYLGCIFILIDAIWLLVAWA